jgi:signal peptidase
MSSRDETGGGTNRADEPEDQSGPDEDADRWKNVVGFAHVTGVALLILVVLPFLLFAVPQVIGAEASYVVTSGSMEPALSPYDVTFVDEVQPSSVSEGDIINFQRSQDDRTTTHRVVEIVERDGGPAFRTAGDNNDSPDQGVVTTDEFRGRVMEMGGMPLAVPQVGRIINFANSQTGFVLLFVIPVTLLIANEVWNVVASARPTSGGSVSTDGGQTDNSADSESTGTSDAEGDATVAIAPNELRLALLVLVAFVAYGAWTTASAITPLNVGVTGAAVVALVLLGALYLVGGRADDGEADGGPPEFDEDGLVIRSGSLEGREGSAEPKHVESFELLFDLAETSDGRLYRDPGDGTFHLSAGSTLYVHEPDGAAATQSIPDGGNLDPNRGETPACWAPPARPRGGGTTAGAAPKTTTEGDDD